MLNEGAPLAHTPHTLESETGARRTHRIALPSEYYIEAFVNAGGDKAVPSLETLIDRFNQHRLKVLGENPDAAALFKYLAEHSMRYSQGGGSDIIVPALDARPARETRYDCYDANLDAALVNVREGMIAALRGIAKGMNPEPKIIVMAQTPWEKPGESTGWQMTDQGFEMRLTRIRDQVDPKANGLGTGASEEWNVYVRAAQRENAEK